MQNKGAELGLAKSRIANMNNLLVLVVFVGALVAMWIYPCCCQRRMAGETKSAKPWAWIPLVNYGLINR
jgi:hypothetical protein